MAEDPEFTDAAAEVLGGYPIIADDDLPALVHDAYTVEPDVRDYVVELLTSDYDVQLD
jgi:hypothetical protein